MEAVGLIYTLVRMLSVTDRRTENITISAAVRSAERCTVNVLTSIR